MFFVVGLNQHTACWITYFKRKHGKKPQVETSEFQMNFSAWGVHFFTAICLTWGHCRFNIYIVTFNSGLLVQGRCCSLGDLCYLFQNNVTHHCQPTLVCKSACFSRTLWLLRAERWVEGLQEELSCLNFISPLHTNFSQMAVRGLRPDRLIKSLKAPNLKVTFRATQWL